MRAFGRKRLLVKLAATLYLMATFIGIFWREQTSDTQVKEEEEDIPFVLTLCKGGRFNSKLNMSYAEMQTRQVGVLLKSAVALTTRRIRFILLCDEYSTFQTISSVVAVWPREYLSLLSLEYRPIFIPNIANVLEVYAKCSTERLFLPWALPELDAAVYVDTDTFFLRPPQDLIQVFEDFDEKQFLGAAPVDGYYLQYNIEVPYYGAKGMSGTPLVANITRWRQLPFSWLTAVEAVLDAYGNHLTTGDQDILNIIFSEYPDYIYDVGCEWNGSFEQCKTTNWACDDIEERGFSMMHGARWRFFREEFQGQTLFVVSLQVIFRAWEQHRLGAPVSGLLEGILQELDDLEEEGLKASHIPSSDSIVEEGLNTSPIPSSISIVEEGLKTSHIPSSDSIVEEGLETSHIPSSNGIVEEGLKTSHIPSSNSIVEEGLMTSHIPSSNSIVEEGLNTSHIPSSNSIVEEGLKTSQSPSSKNSKKNYFCLYDIRKLFVPLAQFVAKTEGTSKFLN